MLSRLMTIVGFGVSLFLAAVPSAGAGERVALAIGNSAYRNVPVLPNPANDAAAMAALFKQAGFDSVALIRDAGIGELRRALREFAAKSQGADIAVVFYAGHGIEVGGTNYIIPVDAKLASDFDIEDETVSLDRILQAIEPAERLRLVILDACRDNPFAKTMKRSLGTRSIGRGLAKVEPAMSDTLIAFAAKAGSLASDGDGPDSPFTTALLNHLTTPGLDLRIALGQVRDEVWTSTHHAQEPFVYGSLGGSTVSLVTPATTAVKETAAPAPASPPQPDPEAELRRDFDVANLVGTVEAWDAFLARHSSGFLADLARQQRAKAAAARAKPAEPPPAPVAALPPAPPPPEPPKDAGSRSLGRFGGKTVEVTVEEAIREIRPRQTTWQVERTVAVFFKDADELPTRITAHPLGTPFKRDATLIGSLDATDRFPTWRVSDDQLSGTIMLRTFFLRPVIRYSGNSCTATVSYQPSDGGSEYKLVRAGNNEPFVAASIVPKRVTCKVIAGDRVTAR